MSHCHTVVTRFRLLINDFSLYIYIYIHLEMYYSIILNSVRSVMMVTLRTF